MQPRQPSRRVPPIGFAHRGARAHAPENTLEAFELALRLGATGLESDVWLTRDGVAVLDHDGIVRRGLRKVPIGQVDRADLPDHIPALADLITGLGTGYELSLDLKDREVGAAVVEVVRSLSPDLLGRLWLCHPDWRVVAALRDLDPTIKLVDSTRRKYLTDGPERRAATLAEAGVDAINLHYTDWTGGMTALFHRFELDCLAWDLQHPHLLTNLVRMGVDGVFSDWVDRMMEAIAAETSGLLDSPPEP